MASNTKYDRPKFAMIAHDIRKMATFFSQNSDSRRKVLEVASMAEDIYDNMAQAEGWQKEIRAGISEKKYSDYGKRGGLATARKRRLDEM